MEMNNNTTNFFYNIILEQFTNSKPTSATGVNTNFEILRLAILHLAGLMDILYVAPIVKVFSTDENENQIAVPSIKLSYDNNTLVLNSQGELSVDTSIIGQGLWKVEEVDTINQDYLQIRNKELDLSESLKKFIIDFEDNFDARVKALIQKARYTWNDPNVTKLKKIKLL